MVYVLGVDICTPLADNINETLAAVKEKRSALSLLSTIRGQKLMQPVMGALIQNHDVIGDYTFFESLCIQSARKAIKLAKADVRSSRCVFVLSSTKGDIWNPTAETARRIANAFDNNTTPIVVSLACASGVSAQLTAFRLLESGVYDTVVVIGCDVLIEFVVSGFQCVHAVSENPCRPFDIKRDGLNLGEAVGTMVLGIQLQAFHSSTFWQLRGGSIHNDANHISGPSKTAEGALRCLQDCIKILPNSDPMGDLACISVHGTATNYNDEMEAVAIHRAGLDAVPVSALKGYWGHTMGAAGVVETILTMRAIDQGWIPAVLGFEEQGTTFAVNVSNQVRTTDKHSFIKLLSGFGGVNAALVWTKTAQQNIVHETIGERKASLMAIYNLPPENQHTELYHQCIDDYPRFFKMDALSRMGFLGTEMVLRKIRELNPLFQFDGEKTCVIMANSISSMKSNRNFYNTICDHQNYFPSPAYFVYTVPNVVTGEIAIRQRIFGETSFYILEKEDDLEIIIESTIRMTDAQVLIVGWLESRSANVRIYKLN